MKKLEPITWKTFRPLSFPCMICRDKEATFFYHHEPWTIPVCTKCAQKSWEEIEKTLMPRRR